MNNLLLIVVGSVLVNNFVMSQFLGICPFSAFPRSPKLRWAWDWPLLSS